MKYSISSSAYFSRWFYALVALLVTFSAALGATITTDATIDSTNSFPDEHVTITDGAGGPASVTMVDGGTVRGFTVSGNSDFEIEGGASTSLSGARDNATLILRGGTIECSIPSCMVIDYDALLTLTDDSSLHVFGGQISGPISLKDDSIAHFYGRGLTISTDDRGTFIEGKLVDGTSGYFNIGVVPFDELRSRVFVHEIPEPSTATLMLIVATYPVFLRSRLV